MRRRCSRRWPPAPNPGSKMRAVLLLVAMAAPILPQNRAPTKQEQDAALEQIRNYALSYTKRLPNFTCVQTTTEDVEMSDANGVSRRPSRTIEQQLAYFDYREHYKVTKINGHPVDLDPRQLPDRFSSRGEYGTLLEHIFDPGAGAEFHWSRWENLDRRRVYVFSFFVPATNGYALVETKRTIRVAFKGLVFADAETKAVVRIEMQCVDIPRNSEYRNVELKLDYKLTNVAGRRFMLPAQYRMYIRQSDNSDATNQAVYKDYRRYDASSSISFGDGAAAGPADVPGNPR